MSKYYVRLVRTEYADIEVEALSVGDAYNKTIELIENEVIADYADEWDTSDGISIGRIQEPTT